MSELSGKARGGRGARRERRCRGAPLPAARRARRGQRRQAASSALRPRRARSRRRAPRSSPAGTRGAASTRRTSSSSRRACRRWPSSTAAERAGVAVWGEVELAVRSLAPPGARRGHRRHQRQEHDDVARRARCSRRTGCAPSSGGNLGEPLADHADERFDVVVLEVSSFQMERVDRFRPHVARAAQRHRRPPRPLRRASTTTPAPRATPSSRQTARRLGRRPGRRRRLRCARRAAGRRSRRHLRARRRRRRHRRRGRRPALRRALRARRDGPHRRPQRAQRGRRHRLRAPRSASPPPTIRRVLRDVPRAAAPDGAGRRGRAACASTTTRRAPTSARR